MKRDIKVNSMPFYSNNSLQKITTFPETVSTWGWEYTGISSMDDIYLLGSTTKISIVSWAIMTKIVTLIHAMCGYKHVNFMTIITIVRELH